MEPLDKEEMGLDSYYENLVGTFMAEDGTVYCVPKDVSTLATYYNKDLLDSVGVKPEDIPDALEDYKDFLTDLQKKLDDKYGPGQIVQWFHYTKAAVKRKDVAVNVKYVRRCFCDKIRLDLRIVICVYF